MWPRGWESYAVCVCTVGSESLPFTVMIGPDVEEYTKGIVYIYVRDLPSFLAEGCACLLTKRFMCVNLCCVNFLLFVYIYILYAMLVTKNCLRSR